MKLQWKSVVPEQEERWAGFRDRKAIVGTYTFHIVSLQKLFLQVRIRHQRLYNNCLSQLGGRT